jgi:hypothetical protein
MIATDWQTITISRKQGDLTIMAGRKRNIRAKREANGQAQRTYINPKAQVAAQPHRQSVAEIYRMWPEAENEFGRLMLNKRITPAQYEAGKRYAAISISYRQLFDVPSPDPRACDLLQTGGRSGRELSPERVKAIRFEYNKAFEAVNEAGTRAARAVKEHAVLDRRAHFDTLGLLICGLVRLVAHYGIDPRLQISVRD